MKFSIGAALAAATLAAAVATPAAARGLPTNGVFLGSPAGAGGVIELDMAGWSTAAGFGSEANTSFFLEVAPGTQIVGLEWVGLSFEALTPSWRSELVISVNNADGTEFLDWSPSTDDSPGLFGPADGAWGGAGAAGPFGAGAAFTSLDGVLFLTVYEAFDDGGPTATDALISGGTLRIITTPIPEPGTYGLMALGLLAVGAAMRKRQQH